MPGSICRARTASAEEKNAPTTPIAAANHRLAACAACRAVRPRPQQHAQQRDAGDPSQHPRQRGAEIGQARARSPFLDQVALQRFHLQRGLIALPLQPQRQRVRQPPLVAVGASLPGGVARLAQFVEQAVDRAARQEHRRHAFALGGALRLIVGELDRHPIGGRIDGVERVDLDEQPADGIALLIGLVCGHVADAEWHRRSPPAWRGAIGHGAARCRGRNHGSYASPKATNGIPRREESPRKATAP
ncbi:MAG: hypothetical protein PGN09_12005 [Sphingomonas fennica]